MYNHINVNHLFITFTNDYIDLCGVTNYVHVQYNILHLIQWILWESKMGNLDCFHFQSGLCVILNYIMTVMLGWRIAPKSTMRHNNYIIIPHQSNFDLFGFVHLSRYRFPFSKVITLHIYNNFSFLTVESTKLEFPCLPSPAERRWRRTRAWAFSLPVRIYNLAKN